MTTAQDTLKPPQDADAVASIAASLPESAISLWGVAPVAPLHLGYDELILTQKRIVDAGARHVVLLADLHAMMSHGLSFAEVTSRALYYEHYLKSCCGLRAQYLRGSEFQMRVDYTEHLYALTARTKVSSVKDAIPSSAKSSDQSACVSTFLYSIMQCLDAWYLNATVVVAEAGQKKIYDLQPELLPSLLGSAYSVNHVAPLRSVKDGRGNHTRFLYRPTGHDIQGLPLAQSKARTRISIHDNAETLGRKVNSMFAPPAGQAVPEGRVNALLEHFRYSVFPWRTQPVIVKGEDGRDHQFDNYGGFSIAYNEGLLHPAECKKALLNALQERLAQIQGSWSQGFTSWIDVDKATGVEQ